ncbi:MAG: hypothetical protein EBW39_08085, partial [Betaproteobacteria bacterium]|nr:hypothetical protein [Betaproteobacteria bacterium]
MRLQGNQARFLKSGLLPKAVQWLAPQHSPQINDLSAQKMSTTQGLASWSFRLGHEGLGAEADGVLRGGGA